MLSLVAVSAFPLFAQEPEARLNPTISKIVDAISEQRIAAVMELARVRNAYQFDKSIVFIAFAGEEVGLSEPVLPSQITPAEKK